MRIMIIPGPGNEIMNYEHGEKGSRGDAEARREDRGKNRMLHRRERRESRKSFDRIYKMNRMGN